MNQPWTMLVRAATTRVAWPILITLALLCAASLAALHASSPERLDRQRIYILIAAGVLAAALVPHFNLLGRGSFAFFGITVVLLAAVLLTSPIKGSRRWFDFQTFQLQPSELAKIGYVAALAWYLRFRKDIQRISGLWIPFALTLIPFGLILIEPDLGTAMLFPLVLYVMLIAAGAKLRHLLLIAIIALFSAPAAFPFLPAYEQERVVTFLQHFTGKENQNERMNKDYQSIQSEIAIGSGGTTGQGNKAETFVKNGLPESSTDFIFSVIGAQWGFLGCVLLLMLYLAFYLAAMEISYTARDPFARLFVIGMASMILFQVIINIAMAEHLIPVVGIALPFVSYGGSSLLTNMLAAGLMLNVSLRRTALAAPSLQYAAM